MHAVDGKGVRAGFIHVPASPSIAADSEPSLEVAEIARAIELAIRTSLEVETDIVVAGGAEH
jgi:pyroglutamyl-peptidase